MSNKKYILIVLLLSIAVHFSFFGRPAETVFDEVHFGKFVSAYYTGEYYFDIHPPLGKLIIAGFAKLSNFEPKYSFTNIGDKFPDNKYLALRFLPTLAGTLLPLVIFLLILELGISRIAAFAGALLVVFDNALLAQSRLMLLDPFLLLFGFTSLLFYFKYTKNRHLNTKYLIPAAGFAGLAISIKWTGLAFVALPLIIESYYCYIKLSYDNFMYHLKRMTLFLSIPLLIYFSVFALHFALLPKPGPGDAFMRPNFRENNLFKNIVNLNVEMYRSNQRLGATHPYGSQWYSWPFAARPIFYWTDSNSSPQASENSKIYFLGNPIIWWSSTVAVLYGLWAYGLMGLKRMKSSFKVSTPFTILFAGYWLNLL
ncbi:MAG: phospholipid carrier-dependent glycosyltransferase, partial [Patescibacteria group bacterium]